MQNLSLNEIIANIEQGICFEATHNGDFEIKVQEYVPFICTAIHDGHRLREELVDDCLLNEDERLYEEDPYTGEFIRSLPITLIGGDSRYEYDLNRSPKHCIYDVAWGKEVWKSELSEDKRKRSLEKHSNFYKVVYALVSRLEKVYKSCVIYDLHSYNHQRHDVTFLFNIGIENIDIKKYNSEISSWKKELTNIKIKKHKVDVSVNNIFFGRGYLLEYVESHFNNSLVLATEVKKVFMNELTGQPFPMIIQSIAKGLKDAIIRNSQKYINKRSILDVPKKGKLLTSDLQPELKQLDKNLFKLLKNFELLGFINPTNIEQEKKKFFQNKFSENPHFEYKPLIIDPHIFKAKMYALDVDSIEDIHIRQVYIDIIRAYSDKADLLGTLGSDNFLYNSLRYFGEPSEHDIKNAEFLLQCKELSQFKGNEYLELEAVKEAFENELERYGFDFKIKVVNNMASDALVLSSTKTVKLKKEAKFTQTRLNALLNHEIGVHVLTSYNAKKQPLNFLQLGLPNNTYTQEGLAILSELSCDSLSMSRLHNLALRVLAVDSLTKGNDFKTTFTYFRDTYSVDESNLYYLVTRIYRGGGFTKDYLYLRGLRVILGMLKSGKNLDNLYLGKTNHHYLPFINEMVDRGILNKPHIVPSYIKKIDSDSTLNYLLNCLT